MADAQTLFGIPVTASIATMPNKTQTCEWKSTDERIFGSVTVFGPGWNEGADAATNYTALVTSLKVFGELQDVAGIAEEAKVVDGKIFGVQLALRTSKVAALVASSCASGPYSRTELVERVAREVAGNL